MASESYSLEHSKKRRIMIITGDESIIQQIQNGNHAALIKSYVIDPADPTKANELSHSPISNEMSVTSAKKPRVGSLTCVVCGATALGYNFDAITCESCKAFFRRNALKDSSTFQCRRQGSCEITVETRRRCSACRLEKCLQNGMKRDRLLTAEEKAAKLQKIEENRNLTVKSQNEIDMEKSDFIEQSLLDEFANLDETNLLCLSDFDDLLPQTPVVSERTLLTSEDLQRVETIQNSYKKRIELAAQDGLTCDPSIHTNTLLHHLNSRAVTAVQLLTFFKQIPEFNQLNVDDKVTLIKYNLMPLFILNSTISFDVDKNEVKETESDVTFNNTIFQQVHGEEIYLGTKKVFESFARIAQYDQRIIQLALITLILMKGFSAVNDPNEPILNDSMAVYRAQNYYIELLWKYMESIHGLHKATKIFNELVGQFMSWQRIQKQLQLNTQKMLSPKEKNELLPIMKSLLHIS